LSYRQIASLLAAGISSEPMLWRHASVGSWRTSIAVQRTTRARPILVGIGFTWFV